MLTRMETWLWWGTIPVVMSAVGLWPPQAHTRPVAIVCLAGVAAVSLSAACVIGRRRDVIARRVVLEGRAIPARPRRFWPVLPQAVAATLLVVLLW